MEVTVDDAEGKDLGGRGDDPDLAGPDLPGVPDLPGNRVVRCLPVRQVLCLARQHLANQQAAPVPQADCRSLAEVDPTPQVHRLASLVARGNGRDIKVVFCNSVDTLQTGSVEQ